MSQRNSATKRRLIIIAAPVVGALAFAGCSSGGDATDQRPGFTVMVSSANAGEHAYADVLAAYSEETGVPVEVIPYPSDTYNTQVTTQLQAGNAADVMILAPGTGQPFSVITLAEAGFLEPLDDTSTSILPAETEPLYQIDGSTYAQPTALVPVGLVYNPGAAEEVGISEFPKSFDDLLDACATARDGGKSFIVLAGGVPFNTGMTSMIIASSRVYEQDPDWNAQRAAGDVTFADSGWRDALEDFVALNDAGCFQDGAAGGTFDSITQGIGSQTALSAAVPGVAATSIGEATGLTLEVQAFPGNSTVDPYLIASANYAWAINAKSTDAAKASAQAFLDWVATEKNAKFFADTFGGVPIVGGSSDTLLPQFAPVGDLLESGDFTELPNAAWPNPSVYDALGVGVQGLLTGQKTVDEILADMDAAWDQ